MAPSITAKRNGLSASFTRTAPKVISQLFKRSVRGTYSHISEKHLHRYLAEFDFRYSNRVKLGVDDTRRTDRALRGIEARPYISTDWWGQTTSR